MIPSLFLCHCFSTSHPTTKSEVVFALLRFVCFIISSQERERESSYCPKKIVRCVVNVTTFEFS